MSIIKSISGIRGTIGGKSGENLTPIDIVECTAGFGTWIKSRHDNPKVIVGRDGRISGPLVSNLAIHTLLAMGIDVIDCGLSTTPTIEMMVTKFSGSAGIIFTASHNPKEWNALKFLNHRGEFISSDDGKEILEYISNGQLEFSSVDELGTLTYYEKAIEDHIDLILNYPLVNAELIRKKRMHVVVDCINSTGALSIPPLLDKLGVSYHLINDNVTGEFAHNPEPLPKHLEELSRTVVKQNALLGISVDPDVDRLAFVSEDGSMFGEEYTLVSIADYILGYRKGSTVSNLSSTRALSDITKSHGQDYFASAVGEVNVVNMMKEKKAIIGGEGNGGIIVPDFHFGRDALIGIALFLSHIAQKDMSLTELKSSYPSYRIIKDKIQLTPDIDIDKMIDKVSSHFSNIAQNKIDGLKLDFEEGWVHMRKSNTEPIIRVYAEAQTKEKAFELANNVKSLF